MRPAIVVTAPAASSWTIGGIDVVARPLDSLVVDRARTFLATPRLARSACLCATLCAALCAASSLAVACGGPTTPQAIVDERGVRPIDAEALRAIPAPAVSASFGGTLRLFGARLPATVRAGDVVEGTLWWLVQREPGGRRPRVVVQSRVDGADAVPSTGGAHAIAAPVVEWKKGDILVDRFRVDVPAAADGDVVVSVGVVEGDWPWRADVAGPGHAARDLVDLGAVAVVDARPKAFARTPRAHAAIVVDGVLDEPDWQRAAVLPLVPSLGKGTSTRPTTALLLWTPEALFLAFRAVDPDPFSPYTLDDEPLYDSEALEIFIDADGDADEYVELQAAPTDVHFDSAFSGGRRKGMNVSWNAGHQTKTVKCDVDGQPGFVQEWRIPIASLKDIPSGEPKVGARWRVNLFRLERLRSGARVTSTEGSAWSPPLGGDFHNLARFGTIEFVDEPSAAPAAPMPPSSMPPSTSGPGAAR